MLDVCFGKVRVSIARDPLCTSVDHREMEPGATLADIAAAAHLPRECWGAVRMTITDPLGIGSQGFEPEVWHRVRPNPGCHVSVRIVAEKRALAAILQIAIAAFAGPLAGALGFASGTTAFAVARAAITIVGSLIVSALIPPPTNDVGKQEEPDKRYTIEASRNRIDPYSPVPLVIGRMRMVPPLAATGYTETSGGQVYLRGLVCWGYSGAGGMRLEELKIGNTLVTDFDSIVVEFFGVDEASTLAANPGLAAITTAFREAGAASALYPSDVVETPLSVTLANLSEQTIRATAPNTTEAVVDISFAALGGVVYEGSRALVRRDFEIAYRATGSGHGFTVSSTLMCRARDGGQHRFYRRVEFPFAGQWDVRVKLVYKWVETAVVREDGDGVVTALRSFQTGKLTTVPKMAMMAFRARATDRLNGTIDEWNAVCTRKIPVWDGSVWSNEFTRHPVWSTIDLFRGEHYKKPQPESAFDLDQALALTTAEPDWTCDYIAAGDLRVGDLAKTVASCARLRLMHSASGFRFIEDTGQAAISAVVGPRNRLPNMKMERVFTEEVHAIRGRFIEEENGWETTERIYYFDGYDAETATQIETMEMDGIVIQSGDEDANNAHRLMTYNLAVAKARPFTYRFSMPPDGQPVQIGDKLRLTAPNLFAGYGSARIKTIDTSGIEPVLTMDGPITTTPHVVAGDIRRDDFAIDGVALLPGGNRGWRIDAATTNLMTNSADPSDAASLNGAAATLSGDTIAGFGIAAVVGGGDPLAALQWLPDISGFGVGDMAVFSVVVRSDGASEIELWLGDGTTGFSRVRATFDLTTGATTSLIDVDASSAEAFAEQLADGWWRLAVSSECLTTSSAETVRIYSDGQDYDLAAIQFEAGAVPTPPVLTTGATATRPADIVTAPIPAALQSGAQEWRVRFRLPEVLPSTGFPAVFVAGSSNNDRMDMYFAAASSRINARIRVGGGAAVIVSLSVNAGESYDMTVSIDGAALTLADAAGRVSSSPTAILPLGHDTLRFGTFLGDIYAWEGGLHLEAISATDGASEWLWHFEAETFPADAPVSVSRASEKVYIDKTGSLAVSPADTLNATYAGDTAPVDEPSVFRVGQPLPAGVKAGDLVIVNDADIAPLDVLVSRKRVNSDYSVDLVAVDAAPQVLDAAAGEVPRYVPSVVSRQITRFGPPRPVIVSATSGDATMREDRSGVVFPRIAVVLESRATEQSGEEGVQLRWRETADEAWVYGDIHQPGLTVLHTGDLVDGAIYAVQARTIGGDRFDGWSDGGEVVAQGLSAPPQDVPDLRVQPLAGATVEAIWGSIRLTDVKGFELRFSSTSADWDSATRIGTVDRQATRATAPRRPGWFLVKAFDHGDRYSVNAAAFEATEDLLGSLNAVEREDWGPADSAVLTNTEVVDGSVRLVATDGVYAAEGTWQPTAYIDLGAVYPCTLQALIEATGFNATALLHNWGPLHERGLLWAGIEGGWAVSAEIRSSVSDPTGTIVWSDWASADGNIVSGRLFQFRAVLSSTNGSTTPSLTVLSGVADMPDRQERGQAVPVGASGLTVTYARPFYVTPTLVLSPSAGEAYEITNETRAGFDVQLFDGGVAVAGSINWLANGYGSDTT